MLAALRTPAEDLSARLPQALRDVPVRAKSASNGTTGFRAMACCDCIVGRGMTYPALSIMTELPARWIPLSHPSGKQDMPGGQRGTGNRKCDEKRAWR